ncbi:hypothetical protein, partial [Brasilonema bromeliae]|uniref:hypothetical protein n=1 Tax=Brasilonema bromeliae TaxID=383615 RepID=UPI001B7CECE0
MVQIDEKRCKDQISGTKGQRFGNAIPRKTKEQRKFIKLNFCFANSLKKLLLKGTFISNLKRYV